MMAGSGLCVGPITRPGESYRFSVCVCARTLRNEAAHPRWLSNQGMRQNYECMGKNINR